MSRRILTEGRRPFGMLSAYTIPVRDPYLQPYATSSIWNTPIGTGATLTDSGFGTPGDTKLHTDNIYISMDLTGTLYTLDDTNQQNGVTISPFPDNIPANTKVIIDPGMGTHAGQWNGIAALIDQDGRRVWQGQPIYWRDGTVSTIGTGPKWARTFPKLPNVVDLYGDGTAGPHGGSHLGGLGGALRQWEWNGSDPIMHVLGLNVWSPKYMYRYCSGGKDLDGNNIAGADNTVAYRWPATTSDSDWKVHWDNPPTNTILNNNYYGGTTPGVKPGALLCLPQSYSTAGITDANALRIIWTLQNFGCYICDATGVNEFYAFAAEQSAASAISAASVANFHTPVLNAIKSLKLVSNSDATHIGGGGTPLVTPVPDISP